MAEHLKNSTMNSRKEGWIMPRAVKAISIQKTGRGTEITANVRVTWGGHLEKEREERRY